jgi:hypothetical protein
MNTKEKKVRLDRVLEYCIFCNATMHLHLKDDGRRKYTLNIVGTTGDQIYVELDSREEDGFESIQKSEGLIARVYYKQKCLSFDTTLLPVEPPKVEGEVVEGTRFTLSKPDFGFLTNSRSSFRTNLAGAFGLTADLAIETQVGKIDLTVAQFLDLSEDALGVFLPRQGELVLPGDEVPSLKLKVGGDTVLDVTGEILRVDLKRTHPELPRSYLCVIGLKGPSRSSLAHLPKPSAERRRADRVCLLDQTGAFVQFTHPIFADRHVVGPLADLSTGGLSFLLDSPKSPIMPGMVLKNLEIQLPMQSRFKTTFRVLFAQSTGADESSRVRLGGEMLDVSPELFKAITRTIQTGIHPNLIDASKEDYDELWEFFFESGFIYTDKRKQLQEYARGLFKTYSLLLKADTPIIKKILFKEEGEIKGHVSALKFYDNCWLIQHLNAVKAEGLSSTAEMVLKGIISFFMGAKSAESMGGDFVSCFYRPNNLYPSMLFGESKKLINNPSICDIEELDFCLTKKAGETGHLEVVDPNCSLSEATDAELEELENLLVEQGRFHLLRVEGITRDKVRNIKVSQEFQKLGLYRYRKVWVARWQNTEKKVFAVCNFSSPGLNLSELTNSFRLFASTPDFAHNLDLMNRLCRHVISAYANTEMPNAVLLLDKEQPTPTSFERVRSYTYWHIDARHVPLFKEVSQQIFSNLKDFIRKRKLDNYVKAAG